MNESNLSVTTSLTFAKRQGPLRPVKINAALLTGNASSSSELSVIRDALDIPALAVLGSKYVANRLIVLGLLSAGTSTFTGIPVNEDIEIALAGIKGLGAKFSYEEQGTILNITGTGGRINSSASALFLGDNGTFSRLVTPIAALSEKPIVLDASSQMKRRPMSPLFESLTTLGATIVRAHKSSLPSFPVTLSGPLQNNDLTLAGSISSQFISALLLVAPYLNALDKTSAARKPFTLKLTSPLVSRGYVHLTRRLMKEFGVIVDHEEHKGLDHFTVKAGQSYLARPYVVEGDVVAASYFWGLSLIKGESLAITNYPQDSFMGEAAFTSVLEEMGAKFEKITDSNLLSSWGSKQGLRIIPPKSRLRGVTVSMKNMPDVVPTLAVIALSAATPTHLTGIGHLRYKESNRIDDLAVELRKLGARMDIEADAMTIFPLSEKIRTENRNRNLIFDTHHDHRLAMALSLCALMCKTVTLLSAESVAKSFPTYYKVLQELGFTGFTENK
ncbi:3-phosphoshikimate 1-carboxyvinyltransferase [Spirochaetota bacterium]|nr:3-phosphoshikimate 1-carboxyvinyltransferase [Spirochaetota bacterium]